MIPSRLFLRQTLLMGGVLAAGLLAGRASSASVGTATAACLAAVGITVGLAWWSSHNTVNGLTRLREYLGQWRTDLDVVSPALATNDEVSLLRDELDRTRQHLLQNERESDERVAGLQQDANLLQSILGTMIEGVIVLDSRGRLMYLNPTASRLLELVRREPVGRPLQEVTRSSALHQLVEKILRDGVDQTAEVGLTRESRRVAVSGSPLRLDDGLGTVLVLHDITELRRLEQLRTEFVSNVGHELKTPLTSIQAYADSLLEGAIDDPDVNRNFVERIVEQSERLRELILDVIALARIEAQPDVLELQPCDLHAAIQDCLRTHQGPADARNHELRAELPDEPVTITADAEAVRTILDNLVSNAIRYTPAGGWVVVRCRPEADEVLLEVEDCGIGIAAEHRERVFERFFRADKARSREAGGTGLGLSIVKHLVTQHAGTVEVVSGQQRGSLFRVRLPRTALPPAITSHQPASSGFTKS
ncbi:MAG: ATP-binding protein [Planctomycetaceae bacterium]